jgi:hypothetical protein
MTVTFTPARFRVMHTAEESPMMPLPITATLCGEYSCSGAGRAPAPLASGAAMHCAIFLLPCKAAQNSNIQSQHYYWGSASDSGRYRLQYYGHARSGGTSGAYLTGPIAHGYTRPAGTVPVCHMCQYLDSQTSSSSRRAAGPAGARAIDELMIYI